jgi:flagellar basal-body rod protein FlgC
MTGFLGIFEISASGMDAERLRLQAATMNIANASSVRAPNGVAYQPMRVITRPTIPSTFIDLLDTGSGIGSGVTAELIPAGNSSRNVYDPDHPYADSQGFIQQVAIDQVFEMSQIMQAVRAYEANAKASAAARSMLQSALRIGERA